MRRRKVDDLETYFHQVDISLFRDRAEKAVKGLGAFAHYASLGWVPKPLASEHHEDRLRCIALSFHPFHSRNPEHMRLLHQISLLYTGDISTVAFSEIAFR